LTLLISISAERHTSLQIVLYALLPLTLQGDTSNTLPHGDKSDKEKVLLAEELKNSDSIQQLHVQQPSMYAKPEAASAVLGS